MESQNDRKFPENFPEEHFPENISWSTLCGERGSDSTFVAAHFMVLRHHGLHRGNDGRADAHSALWKGGC